MDDKERQKLTVLVSPDEAEAIKTAATAHGTSVSEYIRSRMLAATPDASTGNVEALLRHLIYSISRLHVAVYAIPETAGTLSTQTLKKIYDDAVTESVDYMSEVAERIAEAQAKIAAQANKAASASGNGAA